MESHTLVNMALTAENFFKGLEIQLCVYNIFDQDHDAPDTSGAAQLIPGDFPREGRTVWGQLLYKF